MTLKVMEEPDAAFASAPACCLICSFHALTSAVLAAANAGTDFVVPTTFRCAAPTGFSVCSCMQPQALSTLQLLCLQEYYTSGFLSIQAAIDGYVLGLNAETETSLGPFPVPRASARNGTLRPRPQSAQQELFTEWGEQSLLNTCMSKAVVA